MNLWVEKVSAGGSGYGAGEHAFARIAAQRYIRAQKTRSKCRRRFTALHHHTRTPRLRFPTHNSKFRQEEKKTELYRLIQELCSVLMFENGYISCLKSGNRINSQPQPKKVLFLFVEFEIICDSVGWMRAENAWIQTAGYAFRRADGEILGDFGAEFSKTKTLGAGVRIFNGAVRTEREFPLKILFLACIQGFVVLLILRNGDQNLPSRFPNTISVYFVSKYFRTFIQSHATDKFK